MVKPRKSPAEKKKQRRPTKWQLILPVVLVGGGTGIAMGINYLIAGTPPLQQCIEDEDLIFHIHSYITATLDREPFEVPANIGIEEDCMRPLHTRDADGTIHITFVKPVKFTLGNFVILWGLNLGQYDLKVFVQTPEDTEFWEYEEHINRLIFNDEMRVKLELTSR